MVLGAVYSMKPTKFAQVTQGQHSRIALFSFFVLQHFRVKLPSKNLPTLNMSSEEMLFFEDKSDTGSLCLSCVAYSFLSEKAKSLSRKRGISALEDTFEDETSETDTGCIIILYIWLSFSEAQY